MLILNQYFTWHFSADINTCSNPGGGGKCGWWNNGGGRFPPFSKWPPGGLPTEGGGGNVKTFKGWWGGTNKLVGVNWNGFPEVGVILLADPSGRGKWRGCDDSPVFGWWWDGLVEPDSCWSFGFLGPRSCWTAEKDKMTVLRILWAVNF